MPTSLCPRSLQPELLVHGAAPSLGRATAAPGGLSCRARAVPALAAAARRGKRPVPQNTLPAHTGPCLCITQRARGFPRCSAARKRWSSGFTLRRGRVIPHLSTAVTQGQRTQAGPRIVSARKLAPQNCPRPVRRAGMVKAVPWVPPYPASLPCRLRL